jgi:hypothetical protein
MMLALTGFLERKSAKPRYPDRNGFAMVIGMQGLRGNAIRRTDWLDAIVASMAGNLPGEAWREKKPRLHFPRAGLIRSEV